MNDTTWVAVKVGGSLFDWPLLRERLRTWLVNLSANHVLIIPGGGATADAVRMLDRVHGLGDEACHWLAIDAMSLNARLLASLLPEARLVAEIDTVACASGWYLLDPLPFFRTDERRPDHLPHDWGVTSDSLALRAAVRVNARTLFLLKSVGWSNEDWIAAHQAGVVDAYFACALRQTPTLAVRIVNLRN